MSVASVSCASPTANIHNLSGMLQCPFCKKFYLDAGAMFFAMSENLALQKIAPLIHEIRGERVILDSDLAQIYGVPVKALNQAMKRNAERFPDDFAFRLTRSEFDSLRSQFVTSNESGLNRSQSTLTHLRSQTVISKGRGGRRYLPLAFTEHGAIMAANVLHSEQAVEMSVFVVRAFVKLRAMLAGHRELAAKIDELDRKVGTHDKAISSIIAAIRELTAPVRKPRAIGFRAKRETRADRTKQRIASKHVKKK